MKIILSIFLAFAPCLLFGQTYFEGTIHYEYEVKAYSKKVNVERLRKMLGEGSALKFKAGYFRHDYDGGIVEFDIYRQDENREYIKRRGNDTIYWYDCSKGGTQIKSLKSLSAKEEVLGIMCNQLSIQYADHRVVEYYNSDSIAIDPRWFSSFKRNDQYKVDAVEKSIFLRSERKFPAVDIISKATSIERNEVTMNIFKIPTDAILIEKK